MWVKCNCQFKHQSSNMYLSHTIQKYNSILKSDLSPHLIKETVDKRLKAEASSQKQTTSKRLIRQWGKQIVYSNSFSINQIFQ